MWLFIRALTATPSPLNLCNRWVITSRITALVYLFNHALISVKLGLWTVWYMITLTSRYDKLIWSVYSSIQGWIHGDFHPSPSNMIITARLRGYPNYHRVFQIFSVEDAWSSLMTTPLYGQVWRSGTNGCDCSLSLLLRLHTPSFYMHF